MMRRIALLLLVVFAFESTPMAANGDFVVNITPAITHIENQNAWSYNYALSNLVANAADDDPDLAFDFSIYVSPQATLSQIVSPSGWDATYSPDASLIEWVASDSPYTLAPGSSLNFGFVSTFGPGNETFSVLALNQGGTNVNIRSGTTQGPAIANVPEPTSMIPFGTGLAALACYTGYRRWRSSPFNPLSFLFPALAPAASAPRSTPCPSASRTSRR